MRKYRIVTDKYNGYEVRRKYRFLPIYMQIDKEGNWGVNTHTTVEEAEQFIRDIKKFESEVVKELER